LLWISPLGAFLVGNGIAAAGDAIVFSVKGFDFKVPPPTFFSVNLESGEALWISFWQTGYFASSAAILDLHCGSRGCSLLSTGTFVKDVVAVNFQKARTDFMNTASMLTKQMFPFISRLVKSVANFNYGPDVVLADPPRRQGWGDL
jgi:tRNA/tmRNA/rRNA uracil-C5-methylase (TrmA/RlmC/RlmD family)